MQGKVSMVMPCYNKVDYIGGMFDSIISQDWDNIELILVNDGSTDGTRDVIAAYEPKFRARGYEVVIVDQANAGVCAAAKAGLERVTGRYVCMVDADDELDPKYVSTMAGWLEEHDEHDYCICSAVIYEIVDGVKKYKPFYPSSIKNQESHYTERYILNDVRATVWIYMARTHYIEKCNIIETYFTDTKGSHEPGYIIPLTINNGLFKYFPLPLYRFNDTDTGHSRHKLFEKMRNFYDEYDRLCQMAIAALPDEVADGGRKKSLSEASILSKYIHLYRNAKILIGGEEHAEPIFIKLLDIVNPLFSENKPITRERTLGVEDLFIYAVINLVVGRRTTKVLTPPKGRIIGYGALGKAAVKLLPYLDGTPLCPSELWDIAGDDISVMKPDFSLLNGDDLMLVFPIGKVENDLREISSKYGFQMACNSEIKDWLVSRLFEEIFENINA